MEATHLMAGLNQRRLVVMSGDQCKGTVREEGLFFEIEWVVSKGGGATV